MKPMSTTPTTAVMLRTVWPRAGSLPPPPPPPPLPPLPTGVGGDTGGGAAGGASAGDAPEGGSAGAAPGGTVGEVIRSPPSPSRDRARPGRPVPRGHRSDPTIRGV